MSEHYIFWGVVVALCAVFLLFYWIGRNRKPPVYMPPDHVAIPGSKRDKGHPMAPEAQAILLRNTYYAHLWQHMPPYDARNDFFQPGTIIKPLTVFNERRGAYVDAPMLYDRALDVHEKARFMPSVERGDTVETPNALAWLVTSDGIPRQYAIDARLYQIDEALNTSNEVQQGV